ncbi:MAG: hypothetical protein Q8R30_05835 [bacterium]|nr:hypothetical protein [bacterium]MDZ4286059.1 hypothetical protein [Candidatus Sungbacteria bacterium]
MLETQDNSFLELSPFERKIAQRYRRFFSIQEIEEQPILQWGLGALLLALFITFYEWVSSSAISVSTAMAGDASCWPYFQHCDGLYVLKTLPFYSQTTLYAFFFGIMLLVVYFMWRQKWVYAHMGMLVLYVWKFFVMFAVSAAVAGNFDYYDIVIGAVLLFLPYKEVFAKLAFVALYSLAGTVKIHEGWITASYFTTLVGGMPWFNSALAPLATNVVIAAEIAGAWFLLSRRLTFQRIAVSFFVFFHLYSITMVAYRYPSSTLIMLLVLFGPLYQYTPPPLNRRAIVGWLFVVFLFFFQFLPKMIHGDDKWTLEANQYGLYMFGANHQCRSRVVYDLPDGKQATTTYESPHALDRCNPYVHWLRIQRRCEYGGAVKAHWTFDHSINGHPFYRIVNVSDACVLTYKPLSHNSWIQIPGEGAPAIGRPLQDPYGTIR